VQDFRWAAGDFTYKADDLRLPLRLLNLRRTFAGDTEVTLRLDEALNALLTGNQEAAEQILAGYE
jgi:hypothetical protein